MQRLASVLLVTFALGTAAACGGGSPSADSPKQVYTVRGMIRDLPNPDLPGSGFSVQHEPIDDFISLQGEVVGMSSMTMPFPLGKKVNLEGIAIGDPVEFKLQIEWDGNKPVLVTSVKELPPGTELEFGEAQPPAPAE